MAYYLYKSQNKIPIEQNPSNGTQPMTDIQITGGIGQAPTIQVPITTPLPETGAEDVNFSPTEELQIDQMRVLRRRSPYNGELFIVTYNYTTYNFDVKLVGPTEESRKAFQTWRITNYSAIDPSLFVIVK